MSIAKIQEAFIRNKWRWTEETFNCGSYVEVILKFTLSNNCFAFNLRENSNYSEDCRYGWGRFERGYAWDMAFDFLISHIGEKNSIDKLLEYKKKYS